MTWTATLCIAHGPAEDPASLRQSLSRDGRRILTWCVAGDPPAGALTADILIAMEGAAGAAPPDRGPLANRPRSNKLVLSLGRSVAGWADAALGRPEDPKAIEARVGALLRLTRIEAECEARATTLEKLGSGRIDQKGLKPPSSARVLYIGGPTVAFGGLHALLAQSQIELRPVLSAGLALDEMETGLVDAVLLDASASEQTVRELSLIMRRNSDLALCPVLILESQAIEMRRPPLVGDLIKVADDPEIVSVRLRQLIAEHRRRRRAFAVLGRSKSKGLHDARTGLHTPAFVRAHIETLGETARRSGRTFCVGALHFSPIDTVLSPDDQASLAQQTGSLVARLIRAEDCAAAMSDEVIVLCFPTTTEAEAHLALRRIAAVLTATRYNAPRHIEGVASMVEWTTAELDPTSPIDTLLDTLMIGLDTQIRPAV